MIGGWTEQIRVVEARGEVSSVYLDVLFVGTSIGKRRGDA